MHKHETLTCGPALRQIVAEICVVDPGASADLHNNHVNHPLS